MNSVPSVQVLIDELDHRRDLVLMIEQSEKKVEYAGSVPSEPCAGCGIEADLGR